jgi:hypothetical protein
VSELWLPALIAIAALALTYVFCVRPMRRGQDHNAGAGKTQAHLDQALTQARDEVTRLREDRAPAVGAGRGSQPTRENDDGRT